MIKQYVNEKLSCPGISSRRKLKILEHFNKKDKNENELELIYYVRYVTD